MAEQIYLGVDLGAESGRVVAGCWDGRRMRLEELHRFANGPVAIADTLRWDILRLWSEIQNGLSLAARRFGRAVVSVGVDTWGVDFTLLSKSGELLGQPFNYRDARTQGMLEKAFKRVPRAEVFAATGLQFMELNTLYQLLALQRQSPEVLASAETLLTTPDFFNWCLSGARVSEFSIATTTQCFNPARREWAFDLLRKFDLPTGIFPDIVAPGTRIGPLRQSVADRTGLSGVSVVAPAEHDTGSAVAAVPTTNSGRANWGYLSSGTWSLLGVEISEALLSPRTLEKNMTNEGGVDFTYRLLKNIMGLWLVQQCKRSFESRGRAWDYAELVRVASEAPALRSLVDPNDDRFLNPPDMPKAIQDYCKETGQPAPESEGALVRCALESLALKYRDTIGSLEELTGQRIEVIHVVGGGSQNNLLNQFTADACDRPVLAGPVEATVMGNVLVQARAAGEIKDLKELREIVRASSDLREFLPDARTSAAWREANWSDDRKL
ncbi:MAG TPA: rhamnulokinase family protein [Verrucomicrobiae bacterium]|nr:rhamnulokinase family protein [Verrucomicrobiae bacterium]